MRDRERGKEFKRERGEGGWAMAVGKSVGEISREREKRREKKGTEKDKIK